MECMYTEREIPAVHFHVEDDRQQNKFDSSTLTFCMSGPFPRCYQEWTSPRSPETEILDHWKSVP